MRNLLPLLFLVACPATQEPTAPPTVGDDDDGPAEVPLEHGVADGCAEARVNGLGAFFDATPAVLVTGDSAADLALGQQVHAWYVGQFPSLTLRAAGDLTDADRELNLMVVGSGATNGLLRELNDALPVHFDDGSFTFGGYRWTEPGHGIVLLHPSPFAPGRMVAVYAGATNAGSFSTFTTPTGADGVVVVRGRGTVQMAGELCRSGDRWGAWPGYLDDSRAAWDEHVSGLEQVETDTHVFLFPAGDPVEADLGTFPDWQTGEHARALAALEVEALDHPIRTYLYADAATKGHWTGNTGNAHANNPNYEVHAIYADALQAVGAHEDVHVIAFHRIGQANGALMGEGLAVWVHGPWWGEPLEGWVAQYRDEGSLPALSTLIDDFWSNSDGITYPTAGHFVGYLAAGWGIDVVKEVYVAEDLAGALESATGMDLAALEAAWLATVP